MTSVAITRRLLLRERNFSLFWVSQSISTFGDQLTLVALVALTWQITSSSLFTALVVILSTIPHAIFGFFAGPIADGLGRKRALVICDVVRTGCVALIPIVVAWGSPLALIFLLVLIAGMAAALFTPTKLALLPDLAPGTALARANSVVQVSDRTIEIVGKAVAGIAFVLLGTQVFVVDAATFALSALLLSRIRLYEMPPGFPRLRNFFADAATGLRVLGENAVLSANLVFSLLAQVSLAVANTLTPVYLFREFAASADAFGFAEGALAAGAVALSAIAPTLISRVFKGRLVIAGFAVYGIVLVMLWRAPTLNLAFLLFFLLGAANALFLIPNITIYQEHTPAEVRGRVFSTRYALLNLVWLPVMVISGALAEHISAAELIGVAGAFTLLVAIAGAFIRSVRDVR